MSLSNIKGLSENPKYIAFRLRSSQDFKPDAFRAVRGIYLPYEHFPESMQLQIEADRKGDFVGNERIQYHSSNGLHLIFIEDRILTIIGTLKRQASEYPFPQALRFERNKGWTIEKAIEWLNKRFKIEEV